MHRPEGEEGGHEQGEQHPSLSKHAHTPQSKSNGVNMNMNAGLNVGFGNQDNSAKHMMGGGMDQAPVELKEIMQMLHNLNSTLHVSLAQEVLKRAQRVVLLVRNICANYEILHAIFRYFMSCSTLGIQCFVPCVD